MSDYILEIKDLRVEYPIEDAPTVIAVDDASLTIAPGEVHATHNFIDPRIEKRASPYTDF